MYTHIKHVTREVLSETCKEEWIQLREKEEELCVYGVFSSSHEWCKYIKHCYCISILAAIQLPYIVFLEMRELNSVGAEPALDVLPSFFPGRKIQI